MIEEIININNIFEWRERIGFEIKCQWNEHFEMVFGHRLRDSADTKSQKGSVLSMGKGSIISKSTKKLTQKASRKQN